MYSKQEQITKKYVSIAMMKEERGIFIDSGLLIKHHDKIVIYAHEKNEIFLSVIDNYHRIKISS